MRDFLIGVVGFVGLFVFLLVAMPVLLIVAYCIAVPILAAVVVAADFFGKWIVLAMMSLASVILMLPLSFK